MAPDYFRVGRADGKRKSLADGLDRHGRSHRLVGDLGSGSPLSCKSRPLFGRRSSSFFPEISITIRFSRLTTRSGRKALGAAAPPHFSQLTEGRAWWGPIYRGIGAVDGELRLAIRASDRGPIDYPAVALRRQAVPVEGGEERGLGVGVTSPEFRVVSAEPVRVGWAGDRVTPPPFL